jgi:renierapurpurin 18,18'-hydroxylase
VFPVIIDLRALLMEHGIPHRAGVPARRVHFIQPVQELPTS